MVVHHWSRQKCLTSTSVAGHAYVKLNLGASQALAWLVVLHLGYPPNASLMSFILEGSSQN